MIFLFLHFKPNEHVFAPIVLTNFPTVTIIYQIRKKVNSFLKNHHYSQSGTLKLWGLHKKQTVIFPMMTSQNCICNFSFTFCTILPFHTRKISCPQAGDFDYFSSFRNSSGTLSSTILLMMSQLQLLACPIGEFGMPCSFTIWSV